MNNANQVTKPTQKHTNILKYLMFFVGVSGCFSVLFGAWLAHAGQALTSEAQSTLRTALQYQLFHTLALFAALIWSITKLAENKLTHIMLAVCFGFMIGIILFSGSIYLKTIFGFSSLGKLTPFGGISLALAWLLLSIEGKNNL